MNFFYREKQKRGISLVIYPLFIQDKSSGFGLVELLAIKSNKLKALLIVIQFKSPVLTGRLI
ncbi:hypothetical protein CXF72_08895 [Psychromonas sp. MB-3u-54]|nr:hypothetical protein CXF72_08895 [Psychromonas sp. MB-3u-54]